MKKPLKKPEWVPENADSSFTTHVMDGVKGGHDGIGSSMSAVKKKADC